MPARGYGRTSTTRGAGASAAGEGGVAPKWVVNQLDTSSPLG